MGMPQNKLNFIVPRGVLSKDNKVRLSKNPMDWLDPAGIFDQKKDEAGPVDQAPPPADTTKAMLDAYRFAETNKKLSASSGRKSFFSGQTFSPNGKTLMGA